MMIQSRRGSHEEVTGTQMAAAKSALHDGSVGTKWRLQMQPIAKWEERLRALA
jgi:hypothetical protein